MSKTQAQGKGKKLDIFIRVKSGIFGQTALFGQPPCLFPSSIIGLKYLN